MAYADYTYYSTSYLGTAIPESEFPRLAMRASAILDRLTFGRAATDTTNTAAIKNAMCAVAEELYTEQTSDGSEYIKSESQGRYSVTYADGAIESRTSTQRYWDAAHLWLSGTYLLFGGFNTGEYGYTLE